MWCSFIGLIALVSMAAPGMASSFGPCTVYGHAVGQDNLYGDVFIVSCTSPPDAPPSERNGCECAGRAPDPDVFCQTYFTFNATPSSTAPPHPSATGLYTLQQVESMCRVVTSVGTVYVSAASGPLAVHVALSGIFVTPNGATATLVVDIPSAAQKYSGIASASCAVPALDPFDLDAYPTGIRLELSEEHPVLFGAMTVTLRVRTDTPSLVRAPWLGIATVGPPNVQNPSLTATVVHMVRPCAAASDNRPLTGAGLASVIGYFPRGHGAALWAPPDFAARPTFDLMIQVIDLKLHCVIPAADAADLAAAPALDIGILAAVRSVKAGRFYMMAKIQILVHGGPFDFSHNPAEVLPLTAAVSVIAHMPQNHTWTELHVDGGSVVHTTPTVDNGWGIVTVAAVASPSGAPVGGSLLVAPTSWAELPAAAQPGTLPYFVNTSARGEHMVDVQLLSSGAQLHIAAPLLCSTFNNTAMRRPAKPPAQFPALFNITAPTLRSVAIDSSGVLVGTDSAAWYANRTEAMAWAPGSEVAELFNVTRRGPYGLRSLMLFITPPWRSTADDAAIAAIPTMGLDCDPFVDYIFPAVEDSDSSSLAETPAPTPAPTPVPPVAPNAPEFWSPSHIAIIAGASALGVAVLVAGLVIVWCRRKRNSDALSTALLDDGDLQAAECPSMVDESMTTDPTTTTYQRVLEHVAGAAWGEEADDPCGPVAGGDAHDGTEASEWDAGDAATSVSHQAVSVVAARLREREARLGAASDAALPPPPPAIPGYTWVVVPVEGGGGGSQAVAYYPRPNAAADTDEHPLLGAAHGGPPESCYETTVSADFKSRTCVTESEVPRGARGPPATGRAHGLDEGSSCYETLVSADFQSRAGATETTI